MNRHLKNLAKQALHCRHSPGSGQVALARSISIHVNVRLPQVPSKVELPLQHAPGQARPGGASGAQPAPCRSPMATCLGGTCPPPSKTRVASAVFTAQSQVTRPTLILERPVYAQCPQQQQQTDAEHRCRLAPKLTCNPNCRQKALPCHGLPAPQHPARDDGCGLHNPPCWWVGDPTWQVREQQHRPQQHRPVPLSPADVAANLPAM